MLARLQAAAVHYGICNSSCKGHGFQAFQEYHSLTGRRVIRACTYCWHTTASHHAPCCVLLWELGAVSQLHQAQSNGTKGQGLAPETHKQWQTCCTVSACMWPAIAPTPILSHQRSKEPTNDSMGTAPWRHHKLSIRPMQRRVCKNQNLGNSAAPEAWLCWHSALNKQIPFMAELL
jgi:hypothetical protein